MVPDFNTLKKNLKKDLPVKKNVKAALLGDTATQFLATALKGYALGKGLAIDLFEADYNQVELQVGNPGSELYTHQPEYVIIFESSKKLLKHFHHLEPQEREAFAENHLQKLRNYYDTLSNRLKSKVLYYNFCDIDDGIYGNFANKYPRSFPYQLRKLNAGLNELAASCKNLFIIDLLALQGSLGYNKLLDPKVYIQTDMVLSLQALPLLAARTTDTLLALTGNFKKCLILDLDNTLWGGVIGDDGMNNIQIGGLGIGKAYTEIQHWAKELKKRGIILCVASKNTESIAMEPFEKHPEMVLRMDDISVFMANWDNKVKNIQRIQEILNIGFDSMVFVDDNPFERNMVRENLPELSVPELPDDPALYLDYLLALNLFETASVSDNDEVRTRQYQEEAKRVQAAQYFDNEDTFLQSLNMVSKIESLNAFNLPRVAQLTQRSNQFNLRTVRYTEEDLQDWSEKENHYIFNFHLADKFGDHGLIAIVMLEQQNKSMFIGNWIMSCRVLKRGMENFTLNSIAELAKARGCDLLCGEYLPTPKNGIVKEHYASLGFTWHDASGQWQLPLQDFTAKTNFIKAQYDEPGTNH